MKVHYIKIYQEFNAPAEEVWEAFSDHENFGRMMGMDVKRIKDSADPENINGVGSVRRIGNGFLSFEETIRKSERPDIIEYQITKGTPLHHHYGNMRFKYLPGGRSSIDYTIELGSKIPLLAGLLKIVLQKAIKSGLKKYATGL